jgi:hypothetical protein
MRLKILGLAALAVAVVAIAGWTKYDPNLIGHGVLALEGGKLEQTFSLDKSRDTRDLTQIVQLEMDGEGLSQSSDFEFTPTRAEMAATHKTAAPGAGSKIAVIIGITLCVIIVIVIIIVIAVLLTKKKAAGPAPTPPSEQERPAGE